MNNNEIIPTLTLAKMYEKQENYKKALEIYKKLNDREKDDFLQKKIAYLQDIIKNKSKLAHIKMNENLLNENERELFQIQQNQPRKKGRIEMETAEKSLKSIFSQDKTFSNLLDSRFAEMQAGDFFSSLASILGKKRRLQDITLLELLNAIDRI